MSAAVEEAIARIPMWKGAADIRVSALRGGLTNHNYRVDVAGESFVLRISGDKTELLGIHRDFEFRAQQIAGELGLAPEAVHFVEPEGYLVTRFVEGRPIPPEELRRPEGLQLIAATLHNIHALPTIPGKFNAFQIVRDYARVARQHQVDFPQNIKWMSHQMTVAEEALKTRPLMQYPCHNDLLNENFLLGDRLYILDWEYAGMGDVMFDLANFANNHGLSEEESEFLIDCYFGGVTGRRIAHLNIMRIMSDFREAMWALVQIGISNIDFDFRAYGNQHFDRLTQRLLNPNWEQWLQDLR